jgi:hypothetical protein
MRFARTSSVTGPGVPFLFGFLLLIAAFAVIGCAQSDPVIGTWRLNVARSTFNPGPPPKNMTRTYEPAGAAVRVTVEGVNALGDPVNYAYTASYDGQDVPVSGMGVPGGADTIALTRTGAFGGQDTLKRAGSVVLNVTRVISRDGRELTFTSEGLDASGKPSANTVVYDKQ